MRKGEEERKLINTKLEDHTRGEMSRAFISRRPLNFLERVLRWAAAYRVRTHITVSGSDDQSPNIRITCCSQRDGRHENAGDCIRWFKSRSYLCVDAHEVEGGLHREQKRGTLHSVTSGLRADPDRNSFSRVKHRGSRRRWLKPRRCCAREEERW